MRRHGLAYRLVDDDRGRARLRGGARRSRGGRDPGRGQRRRADRQGRRRARRVRDAARRDPRRPGQRPGPGRRDPGGTRRRGRRPRSRASGGGSTSARRTASRFLCIASCGFDSDANRIANEAKAIRGPLVYAYAALKALAQWRPARFHGDRRRGGARVHRLLGRRRQLEGLRRRHVRRPRRRARRRPARRRHSPATSPSDASSRAVPKVFRGEHVHEPQVEVSRGADGRGQCRPPVRRLRRRRPPDRPADDRCGCCPARSS